MKTYNNSLCSMLLVCCSTVLLGACAGPKAAQEVAAQTTASLATYEQQISEKVVTEKAFYRNEAATIRKYLIGEIVLGPEQQEGSQGHPLERSLLYGTIVNGAFRDARIAGEAMVYERSPKVMGASIAYVTKGVEEELALYQEFSKRRVDLQSSVIRELAKIDQQKTRLAKVRKGLSELSKPSDPVANFAVLKEYADVIRSALAEMNQ